MAVAMLNDFHVRLFSSLFFFFFFFFNDTATTEIYTLSLHDALPICCRRRISRCTRAARSCAGGAMPAAISTDRKSTRLNSSHSQISYAVFCLKKKKQTNQYTYTTRSTAQPTHTRPTAD